MYWPYRHAWLGFNLGCTCLLCISVGTLPFMTSPLPILAQLASVPLACGALWCLNSEIQRWEE